ncbi:MAG: hypothetical protein R6V85_16160 [Polyangia bacterium]
MSRLWLVPGRAVEDGLLAAVERCLSEGAGFALSRLFVDFESRAEDLAGRGQHDASSLLAALAELAPDSSNPVLGVTNLDLGTPVLSFVFGQAQLGGRTAVVSLARLRQEFYRLEAQADLLVLRACKEARHEIGHTLGLVHCDDRSCVMSLATDVGDVDRRGESYCASCRRRVELELSRREDAGAGGEGATAFGGGD